MRTHHVRWLGIALIAVAVALAGCSKKAEEEAKTAEQAAPAAPVSEMIKIGVAGPYSGELASYGIPTSKAAELVAKEWNANGGVLGKQIELVIEDDECKPEKATNTATKLVSEGVVVVLGHICSGATNAALPVYRDANIIVMSPSATNPGLTQSGDFPNFYRTIASDDMQAKLGAEFTMDVLQAKKIAIVHDKGDYGKGFAEYAKGFVEQADGAEVVLFEGVTPGAVDYSAIVQKIKQSGADAVIYGGYHPEAAAIVTQMRKKKMDTPFVSDDGVKDDTFIKVAKDYAEGVYASGPKDVSSLPLNKKAIEDHKTAYMDDPGAFFQEGHAAMTALLNAIDKAGSTEMAAIEKVLRSEFVDTSVGSISFDERGDAKGVGFSMYQVKDGSYAEVE